MVHRYYDPVTEQFLSVDPLVSKTGTPYAFTGGDPVNGDDPLGLGFCLLGHNPNGGCRGTTIIDTADPWSHNNALYKGSQNDPNGLGTQLVQNFDPSYLAVSGYANEWQAAKNGCSLWTDAKYGAEGVAGVALTGLVAVGGGEAAGFAENPDATFQIGSRGVHLHYDDVPHGSMGSHLQLNTWVNGVKGSGWVKRLEWPPWQ